jgi:hypothetical protein
MGALLGLAAFGYWSSSSELTERERDRVEVHIRLGMVVFLVALIAASLGRAAVV